MYVLIPAVKGVATGILSLTTQDKDSKTNIAINIVIRIKIWPLFANWIDQTSFRVNRCRENSSAANVLSSQRKESKVWRIGPNNRLQISSPITSHWMFIICYYCATRYILSSLTCWQLYSSFSKETKDKPYDRCWPKLWPPVNFRCNLCSHWIFSNILNLQWQLFNMKKKREKLALPGGVKRVFAPFTLMWMAIRYNGL